LVGLRNLFFTSNHRVYTAVAANDSSNDEDPRMMDISALKARRQAPLSTPTRLTGNATADVSAALNILLADMFALYLKTKNFHWHVSGSHFRDFHLLFDEQAEQTLAATDIMAERVRKVGGTTLRSIGHIARLQRVSDNDADFVTPRDMLAELREDNGQLVSRMRQTHSQCEEHGDVASASLLEIWIDEAERRIWFLFEAGRHTEPGG
jgi:starvation-inducible DNA-binding protein